MLEKFLPRQHFDSYEDFKANYRVNILDNFNFAYDVVDDWAETRPEKTALVWCNDHGEERIFSFGQLKQLSNQAANFFKCYGIRKGDPVLLLLKRRWHYWVCMLGLHKLGAIAIPATIQLTKKDIVYRNNTASVKMIVSIDEPDIVCNIEAALPVKAGSTSMRNSETLPLFGSDLRETNPPAAKTLC